MPVRLPVLASLLLAADGTLVRAGQPAPSERAGDPLPEGNPRGQSPF